jgi:hypothetical protein
MASVSGALPESGPRVSSGLQTRSTSPSLKIRCRFAAFEAAAGLETRGPSAHTRFEKRLVSPLASGFVESLRSRDNGPWPAKDATLSALAFCDAVAG